MQQTVWTPFVLEDLRPLPLIKCRKGILLETTHVGFVLGGDSRALWALLHPNRFQAGSRILLSPNCELLGAMENQSCRLQANYIGGTHWGSMSLSSDRIAALQVGRKGKHGWYGAELVYGSLCASLSLAVASASATASMNPLIGQVSIGHTVSVHDGLRLSALLNANIFSGATHSFLSVSFRDRLHIQVSPSQVSPSQVSPSQASPSQASPSGSAVRMEVSHGPLRAVLSRHSVALSYAIEK